MAQTPIAKHSAIAATPMNSTARRLARGPGRSADPWRARLL